MAGATKPTWPRLIVLVAAAAFLLLACEEAMITGPPPGTPPVEMPAPIPTDPIPTDPEMPTEPDPPPPTQPEEPEPEPDCGPVAPPELIPVHPWIPEQTITVEARRVDPSGHLTEQDWEKMLDVAEAVFLRSYIRLDVVPGDAIKINFVDGFNPADNRLGDAGTDRINLYMGHWSPGGNNHDNMTECYQISSMGNVTAHELVHVLAPDCEHTPYIRGRPPTAFGAQGGYDFFGDNVRQCLVDAGY